MGRGLVLAAWLLGLSGCVTATGRTAWVGPSRADSRELFDAVEATLIGHGYRLSTRDLNTGRLVVEAHTGRGYAFHIWCYADGWVRLAPAGPRVDHDGIWHMPEPLRREYYRLSQLLEEQGLGRSTR